MVTTMGEQTKIQWTDYSFNPWIGCTKVSPGCKNCYAETNTRARVLRARGHETWGKGAKRAKTSADNWKQPLKWNKEAGAIRHEQEWSSDDFVPPSPRPRVFCASLADWLDDEVPIEWLVELLELIHNTPNLNWQLLTKRPENWRERLKKASWKGITHSGVFDWLVNDKAPSNVWIGTTVEDQQRANERIPELLKIPAKVRFLSIEPLLEPVEFSNVTHRADCVSVLGKPALEGIHWAIIGGESGPGARPCHTDDVRSVLEQCRAAGVPAFVKQLGSNAVAAGRDQPYLIAMKDKKGGNLNEWHPDLQVREFPRD
jgi:protein gp37